MWARIDCVTPITWAYLQHVHFFMDFPEVLLLSKLDRKLIVHGIEQLTNEPFF